MATPTRYSTESPPLLTARSARQTLTARSVWRCLSLEGRRSGDSRTSRATFGRNEVMDGWWLMEDGWWLMKDGWWLMKDGWWLMKDGWRKWVVIQ